MRRKTLVLNPLYLLGLILLILNDAVLKWQYSNLITGKLSDFAGLLITPILLAYLIPKFKRHFTCIVGLLFIVWKSPMSTPLLDSINSLTALKFSRVQDYTDLIALSILPLSHHLIMSRQGRFNPELIKRRSVMVVRQLVILISVFALTATSMIRQEIPKGTIYIGKSFKIKMSKEKVLQRINELGHNYEIVKDTSSTAAFHHYSYYQVKEVILKDESIQLLDTIKNINFTLRELKTDKCELEIINIELPKPGNIQYWRNLRQVSKLYKNYLKESFITEIKE